MTSELTEHSKTSAAVRWILLTLAITIGVNVAAWIPSLWSAEKLFPVQILLPWACIVSARWFIPVFLSLASLIEWPVYALLLFIATRGGQQRKMLVALILFHALGCALCFAYYHDIPIGFPDL